MKIICKREMMKKLHFDGQFVFNNGEAASTSGIGDFSIVSTILRNKFELF
jgi:hypothetical protein